MFKAPNAFDEIVANATDENLVGENWELNLAVCDKVGENEEDARACFAAIQSRLADKSANVQLYSLTLADALSKNCGTAVHHEIASRAFMHMLARMAVDRHTHEIVRHRILRLLRNWAKEYEHDDTLGLVAETVSELKEEYYDLDNDEPAPREAMDEQLRAEEEELQRVLALSIKDQGGRAMWSAGAPADTGSGSSAWPAATPAASGAQAQEAAVSRAWAQPAQAAAQPVPRAAQPDPVRMQTAAAPPASAPASAPAPARTARPAFVRALYDFEPGEPGELALAKGDIVRVLDSVYEQWWRGELRQQVGIFPVNYVEPIPDPSPAEVQQELELERSVFEQSSTIHLLLARLEQIDPQRNAGFVEDDELQDLYQRSLALRPMIARLLDRYAAKVQELRAINEKFLRARTAFEEMSEGGGSRTGAAAAPAAAVQAHRDPRASPRAGAVGGSAPAASRASVWPSHASPSAPPPSSAARVSPSVDTSTLPRPQAVAGYDTAGRDVPDGGDASPGPADFSNLGPMPAEEEKRRLFERAKAEVEEYHRLYHNQPVQDATATSARAPDYAASQGLAGLQMDDTKPV
ncbi:hypothetical protein MSPP1_000096 [Malassezia sp. CBS 17886]|nr:hypothetical protein MSPP1_000096 [Malassezia sp. CBS 17886]